MENIYALLFRFLGFGFRLAMSNVGWHVTQKFVILVPDPIAFAPRPAQLDPGEPCDICQYTSFRPLFAGFLSHQGTKTTRAMACPRINCRSQSSEWEDRKKSRGKRGSLCARRRSRKTVTCHGLCVVEPVYIRHYCAADGGTGGELRGRATLVTVDVLTGHICSVSLCLYVLMERDKYVWLVQSRRRPVDRDLEDGLTRECNARPGFFIMCCV